MKLHLGLTFALVVSLSGCANTTPMHPLPRLSRAEATPSECAAVALALKAEKSFRASGEFAVGGRFGTSMSSEPFATTIDRHRRWVAKTFPQLNNEDVDAIGTGLAQGETRGFAPTCPWEDLGVRFGSAQDPAVLGIVSLTAPASSADGRWMLVSAAFDQSAAESDLIIGFGAFTCLMERSSSGWRIEQCTDAQPD